MLKWLHKSRSVLNSDRRVLTTIKSYTKSLPLLTEEKTSQPSTRIISITEGNCFVINTVFRFSFVLSQRHEKDIIFLFGGARG